MTDPRRRLPAVDVLLAEPAIAALAAAHPRSLLVRAVRETLDVARANGGEPGTVTSPSLVTVWCEPTATSRRMCASCAQSPVLNHIRTESRSCLDRSNLASPAQVTAKPNTPDGRHRSIASSTYDPSCLDNE